MKKDEFISVHDKNQALVQYLWRIVLFESIAIVALAFAFFSIKDTTVVKVELPSKLIYKHTPVVVAGIKGANNTYYRMWGNEIALGISNFTTEEFPKKMEALKMMMRPSQFARKEQKFNEFLGEIEGNLISQKFTTIQAELTNVVKEDNDIISSAVFITSGIAEQTVGRDKFKKECSYSVDLKYVRGVIYVEDFGSDCF